MHESPDDKCERDCPQPNIARVWPHVPAPPLPALDTTQATTAWTDTARAIVKRLDAEALRPPVLPVRPAPAIFSLDGGDVVRGAWNQDCAAMFADAGVDEARDAVVFSCAGRELIDALEGLPRAAMLICARDGASADALAAYINRAVLASLIGNVIGNFRYVIAWCKSRPSPLPVVLHLPGCHVAESRDGQAPGAWLRTTFVDAGVPEVLRRALTAYLYDKLAAALGSLHEPAERVFVVRWPGSRESVVPMVAQMLAQQR